MASGKKTSRTRSAASRTTRRTKATTSTPAGSEVSAGPRRGRGRPRAVPIEQQREQILAAATDVFAAEGFDGATSEAIAEASGVARPSVYQIFGSKNDVFIAAVDRALARMLDHIRASLGDTESLRGRKQARANIAAYFELVTREPEVLRMLVLADSCGDAATRAAAMAIRQRMKDAVASYIQNTWEGLQDLAPRDADLAARLIGAAVETAAVAHIENPDRSTDQTVEFVADFVWAGVYDLAVGHNVPAGRKGAASSAATRRKAARARTQRR